MNIMKERVKDIQYSQNMRYGSPTCCIWGYHYGWGTFRACIAISFHLDGALVCCPSFYSGGEGHTETT